ncbi:lytic transglycosylase domain-containing protein (plasmid) [Pseudomonas silesiensis]|uniref:lytic transglycosylase domain-containing protein n=1 Tax=Pseudomonas silesiensis TaxID=1853130 RepID=UPI0030CB7FEA
MSDFPPEQPLTLMQIDYCVSQAAKQNPGASPWMLKTLLAVEGGQIGTIRKNTDGSYDLGPMQINTIHVPTIYRQLGITARELVFNACKNIFAGAWILSGHMKDSDGRYWLAMGNYHSKTPSRRAIYLKKVGEAYTRLVVLSRTGRESEAIGRSTNWGRDPSMVVPSLTRLEQIIGDNPGALQAPMGRPIARQEPPKPKVVTIDNRRKTLRFID